MQIGIDATTWTNPRGYGRFARGFITALLEAPKHHKFTLFIDNSTQNSRWPLPEKANIVVGNTRSSETNQISASGRRSLQDIFAMTVAVSRYPLDVMFFPSIYTYYPIFTQAKVIVGIHDVIAENHPNLIFPQRINRLFWGLKSWLARSKADYILTVSDYAKEGIIARFNWNPADVWVVGEAPASVFRPVDDRASIEGVLSHLRLSPGNRLLICLGGINPHKNIGTLLSVLADLRRHDQFADLQLVLVGPTEEDRFTPGIVDARKSVSQLGLKGSVHFAGFLPDEDVSLLLNAAEVLVLPSFEEGYGLSAIEAAACGTPVIATQNSPLATLLEGGGLFIDPYQPQQLHSAITKLLSDEGQRKKMGRAALAKVRKLTWPRAAEEFHALLDQIAQ